MAKRGPRRTYDTPAKLEAAIEEFFAKCEEEDRFPDFPGMRLYLEITKQDLEKLATGDTPEAARYREVLEFAKDRRESWLVRRMVTEPKAANGCKNALAQPENGGYIDKPLQDTSEKKLTINLVGIKGGENAFK